MTTGPDLRALRARIDELDRQLLAVLAERLAVCNEVARVKEQSETPVIQPDRVRDVVTSRRQWAIDTGVDPDFAEQVMRVLLAETHRIEVAGRRLDAAPDKTATPEGTRSAIDTVASRIDHVVVAVDDVDATASLFGEHLGFHVEQATRAGVVVLGAGGVTIVLVGPEAGPDVAAHLERHGPGIHHVAIDVLNADYARRMLDAAGAPLLTPVMVDAAGHEQFFTLRDPASGVQIGFVSRTGHRVGVATANVLEAFAPDRSR